jgi:cysteine synthase A
VLNTKIYDEVMPVSDEDAAVTARQIANEEGILAGISCGAAAYAALKLAERLGKGKKLVVIFPDRGDRYLSTGLFSPDS